MHHTAEHTQEMLAQNPRFVLESLRSRTRNVVLLQQSRQIIGASVTL